MSSPDSTSAPPVATRTRTSNRAVLVIQLILVALLAVYWLSMFFGTHIPQVPQSLAQHGDKLLHFGAYCGLAILLLTWRISRQSVTLRKLVLFWFMIAAYGIFDEVTQPLVNRDAEVGDWLADITGAAVGLMITWPIASWIFGRLMTRPVGDR